MNEKETDWQQFGKDYLAMQGGDDTAMRERLRESLNTEIDAVVARKSVLRKIFEEGDVAINPSGYLVMSRPAEYEGDPAMVCIDLTPEEFESIKDLFP